MIVFKFTLATGEQVFGGVQGSGGVVGADYPIPLTPELLADGLARMHGTQCRMAEGDPVHLYEPEPRHVSVHVIHHAWGDERRSVPLVGTTIELATGSELAAYRARSAAAFAAAKAAEPPDDRPPPVSAATPPKPKARTKRRT